MTCARVHRIAGGRGAGPGRRGSSATRCESEPGSAGGCGVERARAAAFGRGRASCARGHAARRRRLARGVTPERGRLLPQRPPGDLLGGGDPVRGRAARRRGDRRRAARARRSARPQAGSPTSPRSRRTRQARRTPTLTRPSCRTARRGEPSSAGRAISSARRSTPRAWCGTGSPSFARGSTQSLSESCRSDRARRSCR